MKFRFATAVCLAWALLPGAVLAAELQVGADREYRTIGAALAAARAGDTISVAAGDYPESLVITVPVKIAGSGWPHLSGTGRLDTVLIKAPHVELSGLVISGSGHDMMHSDAGIKVHGADAHIHHNRILGNQYGVYFGGCEGALLESNTIVGRKEIDMGSRGAGVQLYLSNRCTIRGNDVSFVRDGVYFDHSDNNLVEDNQFHDLRYGVHYMYCGPNEFYRNVFTRNVAGAAIMYTDHVIFSDNQIVSNRNGYNAFGLLLQACSNSVAERNVLVNNTCGIFLEGSRDNRITHNLIAYNDVGIVLFGSAPDNTFSANDFTGNLATLHTVGKVSTNWAAAGVGNYYSDYSGYDLDGDGKGDVPHPLQDAFEYLEGNHPLLRLYLKSAVADALVLAERAFPLLPSSDQYDDKPLLKPGSGMRVEGALAQLDRRGATLALLLSLLALGVTSVAYWRFAR